MDLNKLINREPPRTDAAAHDAWRTEMDAAREALCGERNKFRTKKPSQDEAEALDAWRRRDAEYRAMLDDATPRDRSGRERIHRLHVPHPRAGPGTTPRP